jgi:maltose/moltooligosaccharide transporter
MLTFQPSSNPAEASGEAHHHTTFIVGTLHYDRRGLVRLFGWLFLGDFAFTFFEQIFGRFMPLYLKNINASNTMIAITTGSVVGLVNLFFLPNISQWSDRLRTRLGRRIPFLMVVSPLTILSLLGIGFAPEISTWLSVHAPESVSKGVDRTSLICGFLCVCAVSFHFFNMVLVNAFNWLLRDVVPQPVMARFLSWFRIVSTASGTLFLYYVFPYMMKFRRETFLIVGAFYMVAFSLMCWKVKEGEYPEPEPHPEGHNFLKVFASYFHDCLVLPIYRNAFLTYMLLILGGSCGSFMVIYPSRTLHIPDDQLGHLWAYVNGFSMLACFALGWVCDRFGSMRVTIASLILMAIGSAAGFFYIKDQNSYLIYSLVTTLPGVGWGLGWTVLGMALFPDRVYGQFSAGMNVFGCAVLIFGNTFAGYFMDLVHSHYEYSFLWGAFFYVLAIIPMRAVYRDWKRHGGPNNYVPPMPEHMK